MTPPPSPVRRAPETLTLVLPLPPNMANGRDHWAKKNKRRKWFNADCDIRALTGQLPDPPKAPFQRATIRATLYVWDLMDHDNAMARMKYAVDWLVSRGYLVDDSPAHLTWEGLPEQVIDRKHRKLVLTLTPVAGLKQLGAPIT